MSNTRLDLVVNGKKAWVNYEEWKALTAWMKGDKPKDKKDE